LGTLNGLKVNEEEDDGIDDKVATVVALVGVGTFAIMLIGALQ